MANARPNSFADAFFFSVETVATVGYGEMYPATLYGHVAFVRFSRPRAKLVFAANPVVAMHEGKPTLMLRIGNGRAAASEHR